jgi:hypothetical protein
MIGTYNPIIETIELSRLPILGSLPAPIAGSACVYIAAGETLVLSPGASARSVSRWAGYQYVYRVDMSDHVVGFEYRLPSRSLIELFDATIVFSCRVVDPETVVLRNITDVVATLQARIVAAARPVAATFEFDDLRAAEVAVGQALTELSQQGPFATEGFLVTLGLDDTAIAHQRELRDTRQRAELRRVEREAEDRAERDRMRREHERESQKQQFELDRKQEIGRLEHQQRLTVMAQERELLPYWREREEETSVREREELEYLNQLLEKGPDQLLLYYLVHNPKAEEIKTVHALLRNGAPASMRKAIAPVSSAEIIEPATEPDVPSSATSASPREA